MFKIVLIVLGTTLVGAMLISYLTFFFYIRKSFIDSTISLGEDKRNARRIWRRAKLPILGMAFRIVFRGER